MGTANKEYQAQLRQLAELMLAVSGESVTMMKRNAPEQALDRKSTRLNSSRVSESRMPSSA